MRLFGLTKGKKKLKKVTKKERSEPIELPKDGVRFSAIIELVGSPKKYIENTISAYIDQIKKNPDYLVVKTKKAPVKKVKNKEDVDTKSIEGDLFSTFVELEIIAKKRAKVFDFCFNYMPSSIEVLEPMTLNLPANELSTFLTDIQGTLHKIDLALKQTNAKNIILTKNMVQMLKNNVLLALREKDKELSELSKNIGIPEDQLKPFLDKMLDVNDILFDNNKYKLKK